MRWWCRLTPNHAQRSLHPVCCLLNSSVQQLFISTSCAFIINRLHFTFGLDNTIVRRLRFQVARCNIIVCQFCQFSWFWEYTKQMIEPDHLSFADLEWIIPIPSELFLMHPTFEVNGKTWFSNRRELCHPNISKVDPYVTTIVHIYKMERSATNSS